MIQKLILTGALVTLLFGCSGSDEESVVPVIPQIIDTQQGTVLPTKHPLLAQYTPVPNNQPMIMATLIPNQPEQPSLLDDNLPDIVISTESQIFNGNFEYTGPISTTSNTIEINRSDESPIVIQYRLPEQIGPLPNINFGTLKLISENTPQYIQREILISDDVGLLFGQVLKNAESPVSIELGESVSLAQSSAGETTLAGSSIPVDVNIINSGSAITPIPVNSPYSFSTNVGNFDVFVDISFYNKADPLYAESFTSYSLDAWIVRKR